MKIAEHHFAGNPTLKSNSENEVYTHTKNIATTEKITSLAQKCIDIDSIAIELSKSMTIPSKT